MRILVIHELGSGLSEGAIFTFIRHFAAPDDEVVLRTLADAPTPSYLAGADTFDLVVAAAADDVISAVCYELRDSNTPILPFPAADNNLMFTNFDLPDEPVALASLARKMQTIEVDLVELLPLLTTVNVDKTSGFNPDANSRSWGFNVAVGAGFAPASLKAAEGMKSNFGSAAYVLAALSQTNRTASNLTIELDNQTVETAGTAVLLLNHAKLHQAYPVDDADHSGAGLIEVTVLKPHSAGELLPMFFTALFDRSSGLPKNSNALETFYSHSVQVWADPPMQLSLEGQSLEVETPFQAQLLPGATQLVVPERIYQLFGMPGEDLV
jgi:diacylglycerol kinase family enzyme